MAECLLYNHRVKSSNPGDTIFKIAFHIPGLELMTSWLQSGASTTEPRAFTNIGVCLVLLNMVEVGLYDFFSKKIISYLGTPVST